MKTDYYKSNDID